MAGRRKRAGVKDAVPEAEVEEPVVTKGRQRAPAKAARGKKTGKPVEVNDEEMEVKEEPKEREEDCESDEAFLMLKENTKEPEEEEVKEEGEEEVVKEEVEEELEAEMEEEEERQETPPPVKKGRRQAAAKPKQEVQDEDEELSPPQKKGRKRGAAKPKQEVEDEAEEDSPPQVKRGRKKAAAKPKKEIEEEEVIPPQKRGRKKASKPKEEVQDEEDQEEDKDYLPAPVKRGRKKAAPKAKLEVVSEEDDSPPVVKKPRGRPPAAKPKQDEEEEEEEGLPPLVKKGKKRGPAPKPKVAPDATFVVQRVETEEEEESPSVAPKGKKKAAASTAKAKPKAAKKKEPVSKANTAKEKENTDTSNLPKKSGVKTGVERVLVMKGRAAVDAVCPIAQDSHVYEEEDDIWDCMLNQTNIQFNNNKFYLIQLLEDDSSKSYSVWMRWGRVGANGQVKLFPCGSNLLKAKEIFMKKFSDKTHNDWEMRFMFEKVPGKYDLVKIDYSKGKDTPDSAALMKKAKERANIECQLHPIVRAIIELICDVKRMEEAVVEMKYDANKAPLGKLTTGQIKAGYLALKHIDDMVEGGKFATKDLVQACNDFYTRIPHYFGMKVPPLIRTKAEIREKVALLDALGDIQAALSVLDQPIDVNTHPTDQHYRSLKCDMTPLERESEEYKTIEKYMKTTHARTHSQYKLELLEMLACRKESEYERFKDVGNRMLLWHGSRMSNWAGILSQGLRIAPPEAPVTGYMFGKGIYFADMASKSANYCWTNANQNIGFLLLSEVALGKSNELLQADYSANNLPKGYQSVKGCGRTAPRAENFTKLSDGTVVPMGPGVEVTPKSNTSYSLLYNEYIVYDPAQVRTRYLLKVKFNYK